MNRVTGYQRDSAGYVTQLDSGLYQLGHAVSRLYGAYALIQQPEARVLRRTARLDIGFAYLRQVFRAGVP